SLPVDVRRVQAVVAPFPQGADDDEAWVEAAVAALLERDQHRVGHGGVDEVLVDHPVDLEAGDAARAQLAQEGAVAGWERHAQRRLGPGHERLGLRALEVAGAGRRDQLASPVVLRKTHAAETSLAASKLSASGTCHPECDSATASSRGRDSKFRGMRVERSYAVPLRSALRSAVRPLLARPGFSAVVVLTLALGIGLNTAIYTVIDAALIRTLPFRQPERLVKIDQVFVEHPDKSAGYSWPGLLELRERTALPPDLAASHAHTAAVRLGDRTELIPSAGVTGNFLAVLGVRPLLGRDLRPDEEGLSAPELAILTHPFWRERFGSDPSVI